jgi:predicted nuclease with TOPRIM domain
MPLELMNSIIPLIALFGVGTFTLIGMKMWLKARADRLSASSRGETERLIEVLEGLQDQVQLLREDFGELNERVDFAERLLTRAGMRDPESELPERR